MSCPTCVGKGWQPFVSCPDCDLLRSTTSQVATPPQDSAEADKAVHSPLPWFDMTFGPEVTDGAPYVIVSCTWPDVITVATMDRAMTATLAEQQANAKLIVDAVNNYSAYKAAVAERDRFDKAGEQIAAKLRQVEGAFEIQAGHLKAAEAALAEANRQREEMQAKLNSLAPDRREPCNKPQAGGKDGR